MCCLQPVWESHINPKSSVRNDVHYTVIQHHAIFSLSQTLTVYYCILCIWIILNGEKGYERKADSAARFQNEMHSIWKSNKTNYITFIIQPAHTAR